MRPKNLLVVFCENAEEGGVYAFILRNRGFEVVCCSDSDQVLASIATNREREGKSSVRAALLLHARSDRIKKTADLGWVARQRSEQVSRLRSLVEKMDRTSVPYLLCDPYATLPADIACHLRGAAASTGAVLGELKSILARHGKFQPAMAARSSAEFGRWSRERVQPA